MCSRPLVIGTKAERLAFEAGQQFARLVARVLRIDCLIDLALWAHHEGVARWILVLLRRSRAICPRHLSRRIAQQHKREVELLSEGLIVLYRVQRDTAYDRIVLVKVLDSITEPIALSSSARGVGLGVKPEHHSLAREFGQRALLAMMIQHSEVWSG